jgi:plasmid maintenance system killer protein
MKPILMDGANVAWAHGNNLFPSFEGIRLASEALVAQGYTVLIVLNSRYHKKWKNKLDDLGISPAIFVVPQLIDSKSDDRVMIDFATNKQCKILTNDKFRDHIESIPKEKREMARTWVESNVENFYFENNTFTLGVNVINLKKFPLLKDELTAWLEMSIDINSQYDIIDLGELLIRFYGEKGFLMPIKQQFTRQLKLHKSARLDKIFRNLLSNTHLCVKDDNNKIGNVVSFLKISEIELDYELKMEITKQLEGLLYDGWIEGYSLVHNLNVALGNSLKLHINSKRLLNFISMPKNTTFSDLLYLCLGNMLITLVTSTPTQVTQWYSLVESSHNFDRLGLSSKKIFRELGKENYSILNFPLEHLFPEISSIFEYEDSWINGVMVSIVASQIHSLTGKSVKQQYGSMKILISLINNWKYGEDKWAIEKTYLVNNKKS